MDIVKNILKMIINNELYLEKNIENFFYIRVKIFFFI